MEEMIDQIGQGLNQGIQRLNGLENELVAQNQEVKQIQAECMKQIESRIERSVSDQKSLLRQLMLEINARTEKAAVKQADSASKEVQKLVQ